MISKAGGQNAAGVSIEGMNRGLEKLQAALRYASEGFQIVPCHAVMSDKCFCRRKSCSSAGKHPRISNWTVRATCDASQIRNWWKKWPNANLGVATGAGSGVVVFDLDGEDGKQTLRQLAEADPSILKTRVHETGGGGLHCFYRHPGFTVKNAVRIRPGLDIRGDDGLIILPPSVHLSGAQYAVRDHQSIALLPPCLADILCHKECSGVVKIGEREIKQVAKRGIENVLRTIPHGQKEKIAEAIRKSLPTSAGRRNQQVFELCRRLQSITGITKEIPATQFRTSVEKWHRLALVQAEHMNFMIHDDIEETWRDFRYGWDRVKFPVGSSLAPIFDEAARMESDGEVHPLAWNSLLYFRRTDNRAMCLLTTVVFLLAQRTEDKVFSLACDSAAAEFQRVSAEKNISGKWVHRRLHLLVADGILFCVDPGKSGKEGGRRPARYRWVWVETVLPVNDQY